MATGEQSIDTVAMNGGGIEQDGALRKRKGSTSKPRTEIKKRARSPKTKKENGLLDRLATYVIDNQIRLSLTILMTIHSAYYLFPSSKDEPSLPSKLISLSYYNPVTQMYGVGKDDLWLVLYWIVAFTLLRDGAMQYVFKPWAQWGGVKTQKGLVRFAEQAWLMVYYTVFWTLGMLLMYNSPYWMNLPEFWTNWPMRELGGLFKWYYLAQLAFWLQQIFVLHIEARRKDHYQMLAHHIITSALIMGSYYNYNSRVGNGILCAMDVVDILLPMAKLLRYLGYQKLCDIAFGVFLVTWIVSRHIVYLFILASVYFDARRLIPYGCYLPHSTTPMPPTPSTNSSAFDIGSRLFSNDESACFTYPIHMTFVTLLSLLQVITLVWLYMIFRVAYKVVTGTGAEDTRSDDEDEGAEEDEAEARIEEKERSSKKGENGYSGNGSTTAVSTGTLSTLIMNGHNSHRRISSSGGGNYIG